MLRVNEKSGGNQSALTDTSILLRAWLASLDSLTLIWYIAPRLRLATLMEEVTPTAIIYLCFLNLLGAYREQEANQKPPAKYDIGSALLD